MAILRDNASFSRPANADMIEGYMDGRDLSNPEPGENRSHSYRHGFLAGRNDRLPKGPFYGLSFDEVSRMADEAMEKDGNR